MAYAKGVVIIESQKSCIYFLKFRDRFDMLPISLSLMNSILDQTRN